MQQGSSLNFETRNFDVLAFALPGDVDRPAAKHALLNELARRGLCTPDLQDAARTQQEFITRIADAIEEYAATPPASS